MARRCDGCGLESELEEAFRRQRRLLRRARWLCPRCAVERSLRDVRGSLACVGLLGVAGAGLLAVRPGDATGWLLVNALLVVLFEVLAIPLHEAGHALAARGLGLRVVRVVLGQGRPLFEVRVGGVPVEWRHLPVGGFTFTVPDGETRLARRLALTTLAGPAVNALLLGLALLAWLGAGGTSDGVAAWRTATSGPAPALALAISSALALATNLVPYRLHTTLGAMGNDGLQILRWLTAGPERERECLSARFAVPAADAWQHGRHAEAAWWVAAGLERLPGEPNLLELRGVLHLEAGALESARDLFASLLRPDADPAHRALHLNNLAYTDFLLERDELLEEAERCSEEAARIAPWVPAIQGTRGSVLVWGGRVDEGLAWLERSLAGAERPADRARVRAAMALGHLHMGRPDLAKRDAELARTSDPDCALLERVARALDAARG